MTIHRISIASGPGSRTSAPFQFVRGGGNFQVHRGTLPTLPTPSNVYIQLVWEGVEPVKVSKVTIRVTSSSEPSRVCSELTINDSWFPAARTGALAVYRAPYALCTYTVSVEIEMAVDGLFTLERKVATTEEHDHASSARQSAASAATFTTLAHGQAPHDVCLDFLQLGRQLWASETSLIEISPHFKDILSSEFAEGTSSVSELSSKSVEQVSYEFEDSDAETDDVDLASSGKKDKQKPLAPFKRIPVKDVPYSTYLAVLVWAQSRHITFAPLLSTFRRADTDERAAVATRRDAVRALAKTKSPLLPLPVSPKSVYRLADYLSLAPLKALALDDLVSQLKPAIAAYELYSDVACGYDEVRDAVLDYVVVHWAEVEKAPATKEVESGARELPLGAAITAMLLARRLGQVKR